MFAQKPSHSHSHSHPQPSATSTTADFIKSEVGAHQVVIFSKSYCPHCARTKQLFRTNPAFANVDVVVHELDDMPNGGKIQQDLYRLTGQRTVPNVWVNGEFLGGNDDMQAAFRNGQLQKALSKSG